MRRGTAECRGRRALRAPRRCRARSAGRCLPSPRCRRPHPRTTDRCCVRCRERESTRRTCPRCARTRKIRGGRAGSECPGRWGLRGRLTLRGCLEGESYRSYFEFAAREGSRAIGVHPDPTLNVSPERRESRGWVVGWNHDKPDARPRSQPRRPRGRWRLRRAGATPWASGEVGSRRHGDFRASWWRRRSVLHLALGARASRGRGAGRPDAASADAAGRFW